MAKSNKEYELAIKIAGEIEKSFYESTKLTKKELSDLAKEATRSVMAVEAATSGKSGPSIGESLKKGLDDAEPAFSRLEAVAKASFAAISAAALAAGAGIAAGLGASIKTGIEFESAFAGVEKTVNASSAQLEDLRDDIREMSKEMPTSAAELSEIAESAGQLGIKTENIAEFTKTMAMLAEATNLTSEEGASMFAQFANITGMGQDNFDELGSSVVALGNNMATTEADIVSMGMRIAAAGTQVGLSQDQIMGYSAALSSVGIEAEAGGTAFSKLLTNLQMATETGEGLEEYAKVAGMTGKEFQKAFGEDAATAVNEFLKGLNNTERNGMSAIAVLDEMGLTEVRLRDTLLRAANASDLVTDALDISGTAWEENTALANEAAKRYATVESQLSITGNKVKDLGISVYDDLRPGILSAINLGNEFIDSLAGQEGAIGEMIDSAVEKMPTMVRQVKEAGEAVGDFAQPFLAVGGWLVENPGLLVGTITGIGTALAAYKVASGVASLATSLGALGPVGWTILGIGGVAGVITGIGSAVKKSANEAKKANLDAHFGDIALSLEDLNDVAGYLIQSRSLDQVREALTAFDELDGLDEEIEDSVKSLNRMNWKIDIGMELTEEENQAYQDDIQSFITNVQDYATQQQYAVTLSVEALFDEDDLEESNLIDTLNGFYSGKQAELASLGTQLNEVVTEAFNDGFLSIDEAETIMNLQRQMGEIQAELAEGEYKAQLSLLGEKYGGSLNADSFINLANEVTAQSEQAMAEYEADYIKSMSGVNAAYESGAMTDQEYQTEKERLNSALHQRQVESQVQAADFLTQTIQQQYGEIFDTLPEKLDEVFTDAITEDTATSWDAEVLIDSLTEGLDKGAKGAIQELWDSYAPMIEQMRSEIEQMEAAGEEIPESFRQAFSNASEIGALAGDVDALYTTMAEQAETSEERERVRQVIDAWGAEVPQTMSDAIKENEESVKTGIEGLYAYSEEEINRIFGAGFNVDIPIYANPSTYYRSPEKAEEDIGGHAEGGIFTQPHIAWFAEDGPEAAIPLDGSRNAIDLWLRTGELLNMPGLTGGGSTIAEGVETAAYYNESGPVQVTYSPVNNFYGTSQQDVEAALETDQERFARMMEEYMKNNRRFSFGGR
ncbi:phage tail tape measure protein [Eisenbergiella porci]|uniref:phage tail tape measure protein n=1 Tax=Eisenbergiella porci TaxID=2652274 RepID=UPI002A7EB7D4|nr:phage tail tape measure protein [Eisenbergiella porci]